MGEIIFNDKPAPGEYLAHHKYIRREGTPRHYRYYYDTKDRHTQAQGSKTQPVHASRGDTSNIKASYVIPSYMSETGRAFANAYSRVVSSAMIKAAKKNRHRGAYGKGPVGNAFLDRWIKRVAGKVNQKFIKSASKGYSKG